MGIAILTDAGLAIRGYQRKDGELLLKPPATIEPGEMLDEITNNLSFLLNYATIPGMASTTRQFDAHVEEEADELEQLQFPFAKAAKTVIHLHRRLPNYFQYRRNGSGIVYSLHAEIFGR